MIEKISAKILDLLAASATTYAGGNAYAAGWTGVKRPDTTSDDAAAGYVNLFDKSHDPDGDKHRPAIYLGSLALEADDDREFDLQSGSGGFELRIAHIPLVICVQATTKTLAKQHRNQLRNNVRKVLFASRVLSNYWYCMETAVGSGQKQNKIWTTATGAGDQQVAEGMGVIWCSVQYSWNSSCDA
jgi:hypothetical protein